MGTALVRQSGGSQQVPPRGPQQTPPTRLSHADDTSTGDDKTTQDEFILMIELDGTVQVQRLRIILVVEGETRHRRVASACPCAAWVARDGRTLHTPLDDVGDEARTRFRSIVSTVASEISVALRHSVSGRGLGGGTGPFGGSGPQQLTAALVPFLLSLVLVAQSKVAHQLTRIALLLSSKARLLPFDSSSDI